MPNWKKLIVSGSDATLNQLNVTTAVTASNLSVTDTATYNTVEFTNSNIMKFNQRYTGGANGTYFTNGEYQKVVTITPSAASENYQVVGRMTAQNAGETHTVYFNAALRSVTLTDLTWSINYDEEYNASRYIDPQLWVKETSTAGFIIAFKTLATIYGSVTIDFDVIPRNASQKANVTINQVTDSEQTSIDSGFTAYDMERNVRNTNGNLIVSGSVTADSFIGDGSQLTGLSSGVSSYNQLNNIPSGIISSSAQISSSLSNQDLDLGTGDITAVTASIDYALVNDTLQGNGSGFQFFAYNEDTVKVKFANWYSSNDRQYGMGQLWYETWLAAIDNTAGRDNRRIGLYLEEPDAGSTDSGTPGQHPSNARFYVDINGAYLSGSLEVTGDITASSATVDNFTINDTLTADTVTGSLLRLSEGGSGLRLTNVGGFEPQSGVFNIFGNNNVTFGAGGSGASERVLTLIESNRHAKFEVAVSASVFSGSFVGDGSGLTGITAAGTISSSAQIATEISGAFDNVSSSLAERITAATASISDIIDGTILVMSASYAISASHETTYEVSSSYADNAKSASVAITASHAVNALTASYALNSDGSGFPFSGSAIITGSLLVSQSNVTVTGSVLVSGSVTATSFTAQNGVGTPTLTSANSIILSGSEAVQIKGASLRLMSFTDAQTSSLSSQDGDIIFNSDRDKILFYTGSTWRHLVAEGDNIPIEQVPSASYAITASYALNAGEGTGEGFPFSGSAVITGSLLVSSFVSASSITGSFSGDGSGLTGITINQSATVVDNFSNVESHIVTHGFDTQNLIVNVYDENSDLFLPQRVRLTDNNNISLTFATASSGKVVIAKGGHIVSGSQPVSEIATVTQNFSGVTFVSASHNFDSRNVIVQVYDENNFQVIPNSIELPDLNTAVVSFTTEKSGSVVVAKGGHIISGSITYSGLTNIPENILSASGTTYTVSGSFIPTDNEVFDLGSSSKRFRDLYLSGSSIYLDNTRLKITGSGDIEVIGHNGTRRDFLANSIRIGDGNSDLHLSKHSGKLLLHHTSSTVPLEMIVTASFAQTASYALNAAGDGFPFTGSAQITGSLGVTGSVTATTFYGDGSNLTGISGGGGDVVETATVVDNFSAATSHTATHNFNTKNVIVQVFDNSDQLIIPSSIITNTVNTVRVTFPEAVTGRVVVAKGGHVVSGSGGGGGDSSSAGILKHAKTLTDDITVEDNYNALLISPVSFDCTVSVSDGADLHIISF